MELEVGSQHNAEGKKNCPQFEDAFGGKLMGLFVYLWRSLDTTSSHLGGKSKGSPEKGVEF